MNNMHAHVTQTKLEKPKIQYSYGPYNKFNDEEQWIRITEGCPNNCPFCYEPQEIKVFDIPEIVRNKVKIMDMNLLCKKESLKIINFLGTNKVNGKKVYYELICGIDHRFLTDTMAIALKKNHFQKIRLAWDWSYKEQYKIKQVIDKLAKAGYKRNDIMVFMICNWKIPFKENIKKLDLCKIWNVKVGDCYFDNQTFPKVNPIHWRDHENLTFRRMVRRHNQLVVFGFDPN